MNKNAIRTLMVFCVLSTGHVNADVVTDWNRISTDILLANTSLQNPGMASRSMAMVNLAMYDAINSVMPVHQTFYTQGTPAFGASAEAAAVQSAYRVLSTIYPDQQTTLDFELNASLNALPSGAATNAGVSFGETVANVILNARGGDGYMNMVSYTPQGGTGHWEPDPLNPTQQAWGPEWGGITPFVVDTNSMMPPPPPSLTSQQYSDAYNEVKSLGAKNSTTRTPEQTDIAIFWAYDRLGMGTPMRMYNSILRTVAEDQGNDLSENARLFAMATTAMADTGIVAWDSKFVYDHWRPISGIRRADEDGNPQTVKDPHWEPLGAPGGTAPDFTPPFPTYVSGHASFGGAAFKTLENFYGTDEISFDVTSDELPGVVRSFDRFSDAMAENGRSRVYMGIHWDYDDLMAREVGADVADYMLQNRFQAVPEPAAGFLLITGIAVLLHRIRIVNTRR